MPLVTCSKVVYVHSASHKHFLLFQSMHILHIRSNIFFGRDHPGVFCKISEIRSLCEMYEIKLGISGKIYSWAARVFLSPFLVCFPSFILSVPALLPEISELVSSLLSPLLLPFFLSLRPSARRWVSMGSCSYSGGQHSVAGQLPEKKHMLPLHRQSLPVCSSDAVA